MINSNIFKLCKRISFCMNKRGLAITLLVFLILSSNVFAAAIGTNKAELTFEKVLRGGYAEDSIIVSTDVDDVFIDKELSGDIKDWIRFEPEEFTISSQRPGELKIIVEPPEDVATGVYTGELRIITSPLLRIDSGNLGSFIRTSFRIKISVEITGDEIISCTAGGFNLKDSEITFPIEFSASISNDGNVRIKPDFEIDIWNQDQTQLVTTSTFTHNLDILPTTTFSISRFLEESLNTGQYWAEISSPLCGENGLVTFEIVEKGEIVDKGEIISVSNSLWVETGDIVQITVAFKNTGSRVESAKIKGIITLADQIVKVIDTDAVNVNPGVVVNLETFFNPKLPGQYQINARVLFNNKLTYWKRSILNARPSEEFDARIKQLAIKSWTQIGIILIIIAILTLMIIIKKKKKSVRKKKVKFNF